jgi:hypothetical protein
VTKCVRTCKQRPLNNFETYAAKWALPVGFGTGVAPPCALQTAERNQEGFMKLQKLMRMQVMLTGLGAALLLASSAYAQQDMNPTEFPINPGTIEAQRPVTLRAAQDVGRRSSSVATAFMPGTQSTQQELDFTRTIAVEGAIALILIAGIAAITLYAIVATKRERRHLEPVLRDGPYATVSGATTH